MQPITKVDLVKRAATNYTHPFVCYDDCDEIVARYRTEAQVERHVREHANHSWLRLNNTPEHWEIVVTWMNGTGYGYACRHWDKERGEWGSYMTEVESRQELARVSEDIGKIDNSMLASSDYSIIVVVLPKQILRSATIAGRQH